MKLRMICKCTPNFRGSWRMCVYTRKLENRRYACCTRQDHWPRYAVWHNTKHCIVWTSADTVYCAHTHTHIYNAYTRDRPSIRDHVHKRNPHVPSIQGATPNNTRIIRCTQHTNVFKEIITRTLYVKKNSLMIRILVISKRVSTITR